MADDGENMFGRDSDSSSEEAEDVDEAAVNTEENTAPTGGGAAGGFLGQVEKSVAKPEGSSGSGGGGGGGEGTAPSTEGKAREGEEEDQAEDSPPPRMQGGAQPKKTLPRPVYEGDPAALMKVIDEAGDAGQEPDITKIRELLDAGIDVRYKVRVSCVHVCDCIGGRVLTRTSECMNVVSTTYTRCSNFYHHPSLSAPPLCSPSPSSGWIKGRHIKGLHCSDAGICLRIFRRRP